MNYKIFEHEAQRVAFHILHMKSYDDLKVKVEYSKDNMREIMHVNYNDKHIGIELPINFSTTMSLDDVSEIYIKPAIMKLVDWKRAFNIDTYR